MRIILTATLLSLIFGIIAGLLTAAGLGIGFAIAWCFSSIPVGNAAIAGCVIAAASAYFIVKMMGTVQHNPEQADDDFVDDDSILILPRAMTRHLMAKPKPRSKRK